MTTHSPVFVNEIHKRSIDNLFFIEKGQLASSNFINKLTELSGGEIDYLNGTIILGSKNILVTEGPFDKRYLEKSIEFLCQEDEKYKKTSAISIIACNSAGNAKTFYEQVLQPQIEKYDKIAFLFDYDKGGIEGWKSIKNLNKDKLIPFFYQKDYSQDFDINDCNTENESFMVEDLFDPESYKTVVDIIHHKNTHKDFRCNKTKTSEAIKTAEFKRIMQPHCNPNLLIV